MESWDWGTLSGTQVSFTNTTTTDGNSQWTVHLCQGVYSNMHDYGSFSGGAGSIKFHQPSDTFYMMYEGGDRGQGCEADARQADVYIHCQGCPAYLDEYNSACTLKTAPCVCAAYDAGCIGEVHMVANCPVGLAPPSTALASSYLRLIDLRRLSAAQPVLDHGCHDPPWRQPRGKSQVNLPQMPPDSGGICMAVD